MGRPKRNLPATIVAGPKERHKRAQRSQYDPQAPVPEGFVAKPVAPKPKHHSYFEFVENKEKKKKLEFQITTDKTPPPGFEFVPIGNPELTTACKEISRARDAMIFIVSNAKDADSTHLAHQVHRVGHHVRQAIFEEAQTSVVDLPQQTLRITDGEPEPIPETQEAYHAQADAAIRDLFPRIPNTDRQMIIEHAFSKSTTDKPEKPVGFSADITLARRVQLAVLAHIRHTHTRYDVLLKETTWQNARKVVEALCLDILVKWRGDEETGRDQLDEILREVVVISDSEDDDFDEDSTDDTSVEDGSNMRDISMPDYQPPQASRQPIRVERRSPRRGNNCEPVALARSRGNSRNPDKKGQRGFKRYRAWEDAIRRNREQVPSNLHSPMNPPPASQGLYQTQGSYVAPKEAPARFCEDERIRSGAPGSTPNLNGYVPQTRPVYQPTPWSSSSHPSHPAPSPPIPEKVTSTVYDQTSSSSSMHGPMTPSANRYRDSLVHSIEAVSPSSTLQPSFVRSLPPKSPGRMAPPPPRPRLQQPYHQDGLVSNSSGRITVDGHIYPHGRTPGSRQSLMELPGSFSGGDTRERNHVSHSRDPHHLRSVDHGVATVPSHPYSIARNHEYSTSFSAPHVRTIVVNAPRPGERSNPILMEDRGGFYERVPDLPEGIHSTPQDTQMMESFSMPQEIRKAPEPHRVVSWEEGSRILEECRGAPGVEIIPISGSHPQLPIYHSRSHGPLDSSIYGIRPETEIRQVYREVAGPSSRTIPAPIYDSQPSRVYEEERPFFNRQPELPQYYREPMANRLHHGEPLPLSHPMPVDERYEYERDHHYRHRRAPDVIVLE